MTKDKIYQQGFKRAFSRGKPSMEGFYYYFMTHSRSKQRIFLKFALRRIAKLFPDEDPRKVLVEFFSIWVYKYEQHVKTINQGGDPYGTRDQEDTDQH